MSRGRLPRPGESFRLERARDLKPGDLVQVRGEALGWYQGRELLEGRPPRSPSGRLLVEGPDGLLAAVWPDQIERVVLDDGGE